MIQLLHKMSPVDNIALSPSEPQTHKRKLTQLFVLF